MKIDGSDPIARVKEILDRRSVGQARQIPAGAAAGPADRVEVSVAAQEFHAVREAALREPEVRADLVASFRAQIEAGAYEPDARVVAQKILQGLREGPGA